MTRDGKKVLWSGKGAKTRQEAQEMIKRDVTALVQVGMSTGMLMISHNQLVPNKNIQPIIHEEGRSMDD